jgi:chromosome segregation ATPase
MPLLELKGEVMWNDQKQRQLDALREKEFDGTLTSDEQGQLQQLFAEIEADEEEMLRPAMERYDQRITELQSECADSEARNAALGALAARQQELLAQARASLNSLLTEQATINAERERLSRQAARLG